MQQSVTRKILSKVFISLIPVISLFQVSFFINTMKWDMMNYFLPTRYFLSQCFANHIMPFWCPYIHMGFPIYADPQGGLWYPIDLILAATIGYNVYVVQAEYIFHLILAGIGLYKLLKTLDVNPTAAMFVAAVFPITGFFIGHASHPTLIISMAWIPFVFNYFILGFREKRVYRFLQTGLALALCLTGGYVVFAILTCYMLVFMFCYYLFANRSEPGFIAKSILWGSVMTITLLVLSSGYLFCLWQSFPYLNRPESLSLDIANINSYSPQCLISLILPFATTADVWSFDTDNTMRNLYMGLMMFPLLITALVYGNKKRNTLLLFIGLFFLAAAMGKHMPVREWLYNYVPLMKIFRHAAILRAFTLISFIIIAADGLSVLYTKTTQAKKILIATLLIEGIVIGYIFFIASQHEDIKLRFPDFTSVASMTAFNAEGSVYKNEIVQCAIQGILITVALLFCFFSKRKVLAFSISALWMVDVVLAAQINLPGTVAYPTKAKAFNAAMQKIPAGFPNPGNTPLEQFNQYGGDALEPIVYNASMVRKEPCWDGFNPFCLRTYITFVTSPLKPYVIKQPVVFMTNELKPISQYPLDTTHKRFDPGFVYAEDLIAKKSGEGTLGNNTVSVTKFEPNNVQVIANSDKHAFLTLLQSSFPGWSAKVDGKEAGIIKTDDAFMTVELPAGNHEVSFTFEPAHFYWVAALQWGGYLILITLLIFNRKRYA